MDAVHVQPTSSSLARTRDGFSDRGDADGSCGFSAAISLYLICLVHYREGSQAWTDPMENTHQKESTRLRLGLSGSLLLRGGGRRLSRGSRGSRRLSLGSRSRLRRREPPLELVAGGAGLLGHEASLKLRLLTDAIAEVVELGAAHLGEGEKRWEGSARGGAG